MRMTWSPSINPTPFSLFISLYVCIRAREIFVLMRGQRSFRSADLGGRGGGGEKGEWDVNTYVSASVNAYLRINVRIWSPNPDLIRMGEKLTMRAIKSLFCTKSANSFVIYCCAAANKQYDDEPRKKSFPVAFLRD